MHGHPKRAATVDLRKTGTSAEIRGERARAKATRAAILAAARALFGLNGYHLTGTNDVVARAELTRGALYHHFPSKEALFEGVYRQVAAELANTARQAGRETGPPSWDRMMVSVRTSLRTIAASPEAQRILLVDAPSVFGWVRWRSLQGEFRLSAWVDLLEQLAALQVIEQQPFEPIAHIILAVMDDAALALAHASDPELHLERVLRAVETMLRGLKRA